MARSYDNSNRSAAAARTRERIITACAELVGEGRSLDISIPAVAARAQVSQPTLAGIGLVFLRASSSATGCRQAAG